MNVKVDVSIDYPCYSIPKLTQIRNWLTQGWIAMQQQEQCVNISVRVIDEAESARLNQQYRGKKGATNVLAFPCQLSDQLLALQDRVPVGDIAICAPVLEAEARQQGKQLDAHWAHLLTHGLLHLRGWDHSNKAQAAKMEALEISIMKKMGFGNPYKN
jgi:probable rRNA maturation factor